MCVVCVCDGDCDWQESCLLSSTLSRVKAPTTVTTVSTPLALSPTKSTSAATCESSDQPAGCACVVFAECTCCYVFSPVRWLLRICADAAVRVQRLRGPAPLIPSYLALSTNLHEFVALQCCLIRLGSLYQHSIASVLVSRILSLSRFAGGGAVVLIALFFIAANAAWPARTAPALDTLFLSTVSPPPS